MPKENTPLKLPPIKQIDSSKSNSPVSLDTSRVSTPPRISRATSLDEKSESSTNEITKYLDDLLGDIPTDKPQTASPTEVLASPKKTGKKLFVDNVRNAVLLERESDIPIEHLSERITRQISYDDIEKILTEQDTYKPPSQIEVTGYTTKSAKSDMFATNVDDKGLTNSFSLNSSGVPVGRAKKDDGKQTIEQIKKLQLILDEIPSRYPEKENKSSESWRNKVKDNGNNGQGEGQGV